MDAEYRLVSKKCFCHNCNKFFKKLLGPEQTISCELCEGTFCEVVNQEEEQKLKAELPREEKVKECSKPVSEPEEREGSYRMVFG